MRNPCDKCKTRWLCKPYGGSCWRKKRYIRNLERALKRYAHEKIDELERYVDKKFLTLKSMLEDATDGK